MHDPRSRRTRPLVFLLVAVALACRAGSASEELGLRLADGLVATLFADDDLASDIYSLTIDSLGRVVVSGRGYVRILVDQDQDGRADTAKQFVDGPQTGAQGMFFDGRDLICTGDAGLIRYTDLNGDDRADGPAELLLSIKTGSEHHSHSVQRGPDGYWYLIAGNNAGVDRDYITRRGSPIKDPQAGTLLRLAPDFSESEVLADGFRNAYDFAFHPSGDIFVYDSDGERDVSLPWYRPTRVFHTITGSSAGWFSRSWKRPGEFFDMPPVIGQLGRGSPTGVVCYQHQSLPAKYHRAVFVADWTYGRVVAFPLEPQGSSYFSRPLEVVTGAGHFGFAPTDLAVDPRGSLYISVGGRGTRGGVYRIAAKSAGSVPPWTSSGPGEALTRCLRAPQPLSSWSRERWLPLARQLGKEALQQAARDADRAVAERVRAIEIVTEHFGPLDPGVVRQLTHSSSADIRSRIAWSLGRSTRNIRSSERLLPLMQDEHPMVIRASLEALISSDPQVPLEPRLLGSLATQLEHEDRYIRQLAARLVGSLDPALAKRIDTLQFSSDPRGMLSLLAGRILRGSDVTETTMLLGSRALRTDRRRETQLQALRVMQMALGDVGPSSGTPAVFDGYQRRAAESSQDQSDVLRDWGSQLAEVFPTGEPSVDLELSRLLAMLQPPRRPLLARLLKRITPTSHPTDDVHYLIVAARIGVQRSEATRAATAKALVGIEPKCLQRGLRRDRNWDVRLSELFQELVRLDPSLPQTLIEQPGFGLAGHTPWIRQLPRQQQQAAIDAMVRKIRADPEYPWNNEVVSTLAKSDHREHWELLRQQFDRFEIRSALLMALADRAEEADRDKFVRGLDSSQHDVLSASLRALAALAPSRESGEQIALLRLLRRLGREDREFPLRDRTARLLQRNLQRDFGYQSGRAGRHPQSEVIEKWTDYVSQLHPDRAAELHGGQQPTWETFRGQLTQVDWQESSVARGRTLFRSRACAQCHDGRRALGPDLRGVAKRFSRNDLFTAIVLPNRDVSPRYQTTYIETQAGVTHTGIVIYESIDGLLLRNAVNQTVRIESDEIAFRDTIRSSLMPAGLLNELEGRDLADLYAFLQTL